jgi:methylthioribose-1-phosphate isomerase
VLPEIIGWGEGSTVRILDQTVLPAEERHVVLQSLEDVADAIRRLRVRGAPLIGIAAAMGVASATRRLGRSATRSTVRRACEMLGATRPTAVNLKWALDRILAKADGTAAGEALGQALVEEAQAIWDEDRDMCRRIGEAGLPLIPDGATVHTHCNAGALATGGIGTALAPIYLAHAGGRRVQVVADETRPLLQGSRLTAWELTRAGIPTTVIGDGMAASRLRRGDITCVIVGADRIARNGDVANKIGTYPLALAARAHGVPFYVAAPRSTFDPGTPDGGAIPIEVRRDEEIRSHPGSSSGALVPADAAVWNPAFDVTPADLVTGYLTDAGLLTRDDLGRLGRTSAARGVPA